MNNSTDHADSTYSDLERAALALACATLAGEPLASHRDALATAARAYDVADTDPGYHGRVCDVASAVVLMGTNATLAIHALDPVNGEPVDVARALRSSLSCPSR